MPFMYFFLYIKKDMHMSSVSYKKKRNKSLGALASFMPICQGFFNKLMAFFYWPFESYLYLFLSFELFFLFTSFNIKFLFFLSYNKSLFCPFFNLLVFSLPNQFFNMEFFIPLIFFLYFLSLFFFNIILQYEIFI
jgi:hypothetical protein